MSEFSVTFLGTAAASLNPFSPTACCLVEAGGLRIMIDAGIGVSRQLGRLKVSPADIDVVFITHWHFDHFLGLPAVLRVKRRTCLRVYGPEPPPLARAYLGGSLRSAHIEFEVVGKDFLTIEGAVSISAFPTLHGGDSFGWKITSTSPDGPNKLVYSGDTMPATELLTAARGADLLIHEATYGEKNAAAAKSHQHSTPGEAAKIASQAGVGALALTHISFRNNRKSALEEARQIFPSAMMPCPLDKIVIDPAPENEKRDKPGWGRVKLISYTGSPR